MTRVFGLVWMCAVGLMSGSIMVAAAPGDSHVVANETAVATYSTYAAGQSFRAPTTGQLTDVSFNANVDADLQLSIWSGNDPSASDPVHSQSYSAQSDSGGEFRVFSLSSPVTVVEGQVYTVMLESAERITLSRSGNAYPGGEFKYKSAGNYLGLSTWDLVFKFNITELAKPTLSRFNQPVASTSAAVPVAVTFDDLASEGDEAYADGAIAAFIVKSVPVGSLTINGNPFAAGSNDRIAHGVSVLWTPPDVYSGKLTAMEVVAEGGGLFSDTEVAVSITVTPPSPAAGTESWDTLVLGNEAKIGDSNAPSVVQSFKATASGRLQDVSLRVSSGTAWQLQILEGEGPDGAVLYTQQLPAIDSLDAFLRITLDEVIPLTFESMYSIKISGGADFQFSYASGNNYADGNTYYYTGGAFQQFTSSLAFEVTQVSEPVPRLTRFTDPVINTLEDTAVAITFDHLLAESDASYSQGQITGFRVSPDNHGVLEIDGLAVSQTNNVITAEKSAQWTPGVNLSGRLPLFTAVALSDAMVSMKSIQAMIQVVAVDDGFRYYTNSLNPPFVENSDAKKLFSYFRFGASDAGGDPTGINKLVFEISDVSDTGQEALIYRGETIVLTDQNTGSTGNGVDAWSWSVGVSGSTATVEIIQQMSLSAFASTMEEVAYVHTGDSMSGSERIIVLKQIFDQNNTEVADISPVQSKVTLSAVNDPTVVTGVEGGMMTVTAYTDPVAQPLFDSITISDADADHMSGGTVFISSGGGTRGKWGLEPASGVLAGSDNVFAAEEDISVDGKVIGKIKDGHTGQNGGWLWIDLTTEQSTFAAVEKLIAALTYAEPSIVTGAEFKLYVGQGNENHISHFSLTVLANPPVITGLNGGLVSTAVGSGVNIDAESDINLNDPDNDFLTGGTLTLTKTSLLTGDFALSGNEFLSGEDQVLTTGETILRGTEEVARVDEDGQGNRNLVLTLLSQSTDMAVQELLNALTYRSSQPGDHTFSLTVSDAAGDSAGESSVVSFTVNVKALPEITQFSGPVAQTDEDNPVTITFAALADKGDESYSGGSVDGFKVMRVVSGSLAINGADYSAATNDLITADKSAIWTPEKDANGVLGVIDVVATSGSLAGEGAVTAQIHVEPVDDPAVIAPPVASDPTYTENGDAVALFSQFSITDGDGGDLSGNIKKIELTVSPVSDGDKEILIFLGSDLTLTDSNQGEVTTEGMTWSYQVALEDAEATVELILDMSLAEAQTALQEMAYRHDGEQFTGSERKVTVNWLEDANGTQLVPPSLAQSSVSLSPVNDGMTVSGIDGGSVIVTAGGDPEAVPLFAQARSRDIDETKLTDLWLANKNYPSTSSGSWGLAEGRGVLSGGDLTFENNDAVSVNGKTIGTISYGYTGQNGGELYLVFASDATTEDLEALLSAMTYVEPGALPRTQFELSIYEGAQETYSEFSITSRSAPPFISGFDETVSSVIVGSEVKLVGQAEVSVQDSDNTHLEHGELTISRTTLLTGKFALSERGILSGDDLLFESGETLYYQSNPVGLVQKAGQANDDVEVKLTSFATPDVVARLLNSIVYIADSIGVHGFEVRLSDRAESEITGVSNTSVVNIQFYLPDFSPIVVDQEEDFEGNIGSVTVTENGRLKGDTVTGVVENQGVVEVAVLGPFGQIIGGMIQGDLQSQGSLVGVTIESGASVVGGNVVSTIQNNGHISNVTLSPSAVISGGVVSGSLSGSSSSPGVVNSQILAGTFLENVIIGPEARIEGDLVFGDNVRFSSGDTIPEGVNLSGMLDALFWHDEHHIPGVLLNDERFTVDPEEKDMIAQLHNVPLINDSFDALGQNPLTGELEFDGGQFSSRVFPVAVKQAAEGTEPGISITDDGDIELITEGGQSIISYPVPAARGTLETQFQDMGLTVKYDDRANLHVEVPGNTDNGQRFQARPDVVATVVSNDRQPGIDLRARDVPANTVQAVMIFEDENGVMKQQSLHPVPADWLSLKTELQNISGGGQVSIDEVGVITVNIAGATIQVIADYTVTAAQAGDNSGELEIIEVGDVNADGITDYRMTLPDGRTQLLYQLP